MASALNYYELDNLMGRMPKKKCCLYSSSLFMLFEKKNASAQIIQIRLICGQLKKERVSPQKFQKTQLFSITNADAT